MRVPAVRVDAWCAALLSGLVLAGCQFNNWESSSPYVTDEVRWTGEPQGLTGAPFLGKPLTFQAESWHWVDNTAYTSTLSVSTWTISLVDDHGSAVAGSALDLGPHTSAFRPAEPLKPGVTYTATVRGLYSWTFVPTWPATLDPGFLVAPVVGASAAALALPPSGGALVAGRLDAAPGALVLRYGDGGELDPTFGISGSVRVTDAVPGASGNVIEAVALALDPMERILVAGHWSGSSAAGWDAFRLDGHGAIDAGFGQGGFHAAEVPGMVHWAYPIWIRLKARADGALIIALGTSELVRLDPSGALDASFGLGGGLDLGADIVGFEPLDDGGLLVATSIHGCPARVSRYDSNGALDTSYGTGGSACVTGMYDLGTFTVDSMGRALLAGQVTWWSATVARLTTDGQPDATFGTSGVVTLEQSDHQRSCMFLATAGGRAALATNNHCRESDPRWGTLVTWLGETGLQERREVVPSDIFPWELAIDAVGRLYLAARWKPYLGYPPSELLLLRFLPQTP